MVPTTFAIRSAYRHLLRTALQAIRYSKPARYGARNILRDSFRNSPSSAFNPGRIQKTLEFLRTASEHNGTEHRILKNILFVRYWRDYPNKNKLYGAIRDNTDVGLDLRQNSKAHFDATLTMLNESLGLCLRV